MKMTDDIRQADRELFFFRKTDTFFLVRSCTKSFPSTGISDSLFLNGLYHCLSQSSIKNQPVQIIIESDSLKISDAIRAHLPNVRIINTHNLLTDFLWTSIKGPTLFLCDLRNCQPKNHPVHTDLANLCNEFISKETENDTIEYLKQMTKNTTESVSGPYTQEPVVLSEKSGKTKIWSMTAAIKQDIHSEISRLSTNKSLVYQTKPEKKGRLTLQKTATPGSGTGAYMLIPEGSSDLQCYRIMRYQFNMKNKAICLDAPSQIARNITRWLLNTGDDSKLCHIYLISPFWNLAMLVRKSFSEIWPYPSAPHFRIPDLLTGWNPSITFLQFLAESRHPPSLLIDMSRYPDILCMIKTER